MWTEPLVTGQRIQQEAICYQWFKQRLILSVSKPSISQPSQIKEDTVEPSVPAREFNLKAYAAITWHNDPASLGLEPTVADHCSQAARTAMLPTAPLRQASVMCVSPCVSVWHIGQPEGRTESSWSTCRKQQAKDWGWNADGGRAAGCTEVLIVSELYVIYTVFQKNIWLHRRR